MPQISGNKAEKLKTVKVVNDDDDGGDYDDDVDDDKLEEAEKLFKVFAEAASKKWNSGKSKCPQQLFHWPSLIAGIDAVYKWTALL